MLSEGAVVERRGGCWANGRFRVRAVNGTGVSSDPMVPSGANSEGEIIRPYGLLTSIVACELIQLEMPAHQFCGYNIRPRETQAE
eukprot:SAG11_NODE_528_length_8722_cov_5.291198_7_plen_85_part_00